MLYKMLEWFCMGLSFGMGFCLAYALLKLIGGFIASAQPIHM